MNYHEKHEERIVQNTSLPAPAFYLMLYVVRSSLARNKKPFLSLKMKNDLLEGVDDGRGIRCTVLL
jgi:hypothetical protein